MTEATYSFDVFLGHASEDKPAIRRLARQLEAAGFTVWLDEEQLPPGASPAQDLPGRLETVHHLVLWITEAWLKKDFTLWELTLFHKAKRPGRHIIPLLHTPWDDAKLGPYLFDKVAIDPTDDEDDRLWQIVCGLKAQPRGPRDQWATRGRALAQKAPPPKPTQDLYRLRWTSTRRDLSEANGPEVLEPNELFLPPGTHHFGRRHEKPPENFHPLLGATHRLSRCAFQLDLGTELRITRPAAAGELQIDGKRLPTGETRTIRPGTRIVCGGLQLELDRA